MLSPDIYVHLTMTPDGYVVVAGSNSHNNYAVTCDRARSNCSIQDRSEEQEICDNTEKSSGIAHLQGLKWYHPARSDIKENKLKKKTHSLKPERH